MGPKAKVLTSPRIMPWFTKLWNGSFLDTTPMSNKNCKITDGQD